MRPTYFLPQTGTIYVCLECGLHCLDHLDDVAALAAAPYSEDVARRHFTYVDTVLQSNRQRFLSKLALVKKHVALSTVRCLDVGAGGGGFMQLLRSEGAEVLGIEPDPLNRRFAHERYRLTLSSELLEAPYWQAGHADSFDVVTLWDVLEHVNFPRETLLAASRLLRPGGFLALDTPARDAFLYRMGELAYRSSGGRSSQLLAAQYSCQSFGHKQIFAGTGLCDLLRSVGLELLSFERLHELSFPYRVYLARLLGSAGLARLAEPLARAFFRFLPVHNKMVIVARKRAAMEPDTAADPG